MRPYTEMITHVKGYAKNAGVSVDTLIQAAGKIVIDDNGIFDRDKYLTYTCFSVEQSIYDGEAVHLFMPDREFCDWLVSCVPELDYKQATTLAESLGDKCAVLHFPTTSKLHSVGFWLPSNLVELDGTDAPAYKQLIMTFSKQAHIPNAHVSVFLTSEGKCSEHSMWYAKLIVGLGMYLSCFPEQKLSGIPSDLKHAGWYKGESCQTIKIAEKIVVRDGPTPHYRVGHFRILKSEVFTKKRWQTVFVSGCFVKGKAETILSTNENPVDISVAV